MDIERQNFMEEVAKEIKKLNEFRTKFQTELKKNYGIEIGDCIEEETIKNAFEGGETVKELLDWIAEKRDLTNINNTGFLFN